MSTVVKVRVNPSDPTQGYILWDTGKFEAMGGAPAIPQGGDYGGGFQDGLAPIFFDALNSSIFMVDFQITDWVTPGGYVLDNMGNLREFGSAAPPTPRPLPTLLDFRWRGLAMNPAANGQGYRMDWTGFMDWVGGAPAVAIGELYYGTVVDLELDWATKKYYFLDRYGAIHHRNGAVAAAYAADIQPVAERPVPFVGIVSSARTIKIYDWVNGRGWMMIGYGRWFNINGAPNILRDPIWQTDFLRDFDIADAGQSGNSVHMKYTTGYGGFDSFLQVSKPYVLVGGQGSSAETPPSPTTNTTRPPFMWSYLGSSRQAAWEVAVLASAVWNVGGTNEVDTVSLTGSPTGGTFTLIVNGRETGLINYNAAHATVRAAVEALTNVEVGDVASSGGPLPGGVVLTFQARLGKQSVKVEAGKNNLIGGVTPTASIVRTTSGSASTDPETAAAVYRKNGDTPDVFGFTPEEDLPNDATGLRVYIRSQSRDGLWSDWEYRQWVQNATKHAAPTLAVTQVGSTPVVQCVVNGAVIANSLIGVQYQDSDDPAGVWHWVRDVMVDGGAYAVTPNGSGDATVHDREVRPGVARSYRAQLYVVDPYLAGNWSTTQTITIPTGKDYYLTAPANAGLGGLVKVVPPLKWKHPTGAASQRAAQRRFPVVTTDGVLKAGEADLEVRTLNKADFQALMAMLQSDLSLLYRDPFGEGRFVRIIGDVSYDYMRATPTASETYGTRFARELTMTIEEIDRPPVFTDETLVVPPGAV